MKKTVGYLPVTGGHKIYWEQYGNPNGVPVVVLHGGPGRGIQRNVLKYFNLRKWNVVMFDQRGCGKSKPFLELKYNTTWHLVQDIERLKSHFAIDKWVVFGGSWGTTLALAYGQCYPESISHFVLRGICLLSDYENNWLYSGNGGAANIYRDEWIRFIKPLRTSGQPILNYSNPFWVLRQYKKLFSCSDQKVKDAAILAWNRWEFILSYSKNHKINTDTPKEQESLAIIENHFFIHKGWLTPNELLKGMHKIRHIPATIIQGEHDYVCPKEIAYKLKKSWPKAKLIVTNAGHASTESANKIKQTLSAIVRDSTHSLRYSLH